MSNNFKKEFERYREAIDTDINGVENVISWLETYRANFEDYEINKVIGFFRGYLSRIKTEKIKTTELSWYIEPGAENENN